VLEKTGAADNTLIVFTSDNGGLWHTWKFVERDDVASGRVTPRAKYTADYGHASNGQLRGTKADIWEGGHRVPFIIRWPGRAKPRSVSDHLVCLTELLATCADLMGVKLPAAAGPDSISLVPVFIDPSRPKPVRDHVVLHSLRGVFAIRQGDWKLIPARGSGGFSAPINVRDAAGPAGQLYNLRSDPAESRNVYDN
jgi:arylsulfatase A